MKKEESIFEVIENEHIHEHEHEDMVELLDENGVKVLFNIIANLEIEDQEYAILSNAEDEDEVLIFRVSEENDEFVFETIEDEAEIASVIEAYNELLDEMDEEESE